MQPSDSRRKVFTEPIEALGYIRTLYQESIETLRASLAEFGRGTLGATRVRAFYPYVRLKTESASRSDSRRSFGFVAGPGVYATTVTRQDLFGRYHSEQLRLLVKNHGVALEVGLSQQPIPIHFALSDELVLDASFDEQIGRDLSDHFDLPDLAAMDDTIANGLGPAGPYATQPLALFTAPRVDY